MEFIIQFISFKLFIVSKSVENICFNSEAKNVILKSIINLDNINKLLLIAFFIKLKQVSLISSNDNSPNILLVPSLDLSKNNL